MNSDMHYCITTLDYFYVIYTISVCQYRIIAIILVILKSESNP